MQEYCTSGSGQGAPGNRRSYCETGQSKKYRIWSKLNCSDPLLSHLFVIPAKAGMQLIPLWNFMSIVFAMP